MSDIIPAPVVQIPDLPAQEPQAFRLTFTTDVVFVLTSEARASLLRKLDIVRKHLAEGKQVPSELRGFENALSKIPPEADEDFVVHTTLGECQSAIIEDTCEYVPQSPEGTASNVVRVSYADTPPRRDVPADAVPVVVSIGDRHKA